MRVDLKIWELQLAMAVFIKIANLSIRAISLNLES